MEIARVTDYLDDKLQTAADLESLDALLSSVKQQQDLLKQQLDEAKQSQNVAHAELQQHREQLQSDISAFQKEQADIDRRLLIVTQSDSSDDAARQFQSTMERLQKLDIAAGYVELLRDVDALRSETLTLLSKADDTALVPLRKLQRLVLSLKSLQSAAEGAAPHLLDYISRHVGELQQNIETSYAKDLDKTLQKMNWPKATTTVPLALLEEWTINIGRLLDLQKLTLETSNDAPETAEDPAPLLPLQVLVHALEQRFTYHFSGNKPTNRLDKPEYFLSHVTELIREHSAFVQDSLQPILLRHFRSSEQLFAVPAYIDATTAFITALMPMLKRKLQSFGSQLTDQPALLSHLVQEVIVFDNGLQEIYSYAPRSADEPWRGLSYFVLTTCGHFDRWLSGEKEFALQRYQAIVEAADAGELDYDAVAGDAAKPTKSAIRVNDLLETITERYRHLASFTQKVRFLIDIQIEIFDMYYRRLNDGLAAYLTATSSLARTMHTIAKEDAVDLSGVKGLDRLCRIFGSADYLERAMMDWSDDVFFLDLWLELDFRAKNPSGATGVDAARSSTWREMRNKTSSGAGPSQANGAAEASGTGPRIEGALFDETSTSYHRLRVRSENVIIETITSQIAYSLRPYTALTSWSSLSSSSPAAVSSGGGGGNNVSSELDSTLHLLETYLVYLRRATGLVSTRRIARALGGAISNALWNGILAPSRAAFSTAGIAQLRTDVQALIGAMENSLGAYVGRINDPAARAKKAGLGKVWEAVLFIGLPVRGELQRELPSRAGDVGEEEEDAAWNEIEDGADENTANDNVDGSVAVSTQMSLFQAERLVFRDNQGAREVLDTLALEILTEAEARDLLRKRVELGS